MLHDRTIPGRRENLDHLVVTPSGVWSVDAKVYRGRIDTGGRWRAGRYLHVGRRDCEKLLAQSLRQQDHLRRNLTVAGLPDLPVHGTLCFLDGQWGPGAKGARVGDVHITDPRRLKRLLRGPARDARGALTVEQVQYVAAKLDEVFLPAS